MFSRQKRFGIYQTDERPFIGNKNILKNGVSTFVGKVGEFTLTHFLLKI